MSFPRRYVSTLLVLTAGWFLSAGGARGQLSREYDLKAVFLYNFASFVEWPESAFAGPEAPFVVGILGHDPFGRVLDDVEEAGGCHILFVSASERRRVQEILDRWRHAPMLTVADFPDFVELGGAIGFRTEDKRLKVDVNAGAARAAGLTVSSKLLKVARVIGEPSS